MAEKLAWREVIWPQPLDPGHVRGLLKRWSADTDRSPIVVEIRATNGRIRYLFGTRSSAVRTVADLVEELLPGTVLTALSMPRAQTRSNARVQIVSQALSLDTADPLPATRLILQALSGAKNDGEHTVLQLILGPGIPPRFMNAAEPDPSTSWLDLLFRGERPASTQVRSSLQGKKGQPGFRTILRLGVTAPTKPGTAALMSALASSLQTVQGAGTKLRFVPESNTIDRTVLPGRWTTHLSLDDVLALCCFPLGEESLPGLPSGHPKALRPPPTYLAPSAAFAQSSAPGTNVRLGISTQDRVYNSAFVGPIGSGKSTAMLHLIKHDLEAGYGMLILDPKSDLASDTLHIIPPHRQNDVVVLDPASAQPVGLNPLATPGSPELIADSVLAVLKELFGSAFGPRTTDIFHSALLTLTYHGKSSLVWLPKLLGDPAFRRQLTSTLNDPVGLEPFWAQFNAQSVGQQAVAIAPGMSRLRQLLLRPSLRAILGQIEPRFNLQDIFLHNKILIVPLNKGILGAEAAKLLGSLIVSQFWQLTLAQGALPQNARKPVSVFLDETQNFLHLPTDLTEALSQSRAMNVNWNLAYQYRKLMPEDMLAAIDANCRNQIIFGMENADATTMAKKAPGLDAIDFESLDQYEIYTRLMNQGHQTGWISGKTLPPPQPVSNELDIRARSESRYGHLPTLEELGIFDTPDPTDEPIGRITKKAQP